MGKQLYFSKEYLKSAHFVVEFTDPPAPGRTYATNRTFDVICNTVERALVLVRQQHPDAVVHVIRRVGTRAPIIIDLEELGLPKNEGE